MTNAVDVARLSKVYRDTTALDGISLTLEADKIYGLLGRNGAGKTTIMQILAAQAFPTSGEVRIFGENPHENSHVLSQLCLVRDRQKYPETFTIRDVLDLSAAFFPRWDSEFAATLFQDFQLPARRRMKALSLGMHSAVGIIIGLASRAPLTIFDEPHLGLDAVSREIFYDRLIEDYAEHPRTVIISTHLIDEVSKLLEHIIVLDKGRVLLNAEADTLREQAFTVIGAAEPLATFTAGKTLLREEQFGSLLEVTILGHVDAQERRQAEAAGLQFAPVSLQQLVGYLTTGTSRRKVLEER